MSTFVRPPERHLRWPRVRSLGTAALGGLLLVGLAACGSSSDHAGVASVSGDSSTSSAPSASPSSGSNDLLGFAKCMRSHNIDLPDPDPNEGVRGLAPLIQDAMQKSGSSAVRSAMSACASYMPGLEGQRDNPQRSQQMYAYVGCLQDHGADVSDPDPTTGQLAKDDLQKLMNPDPTTKKAMDACQDRRPGLAKSAGGGSR